MAQQVERKEGRQAIVERIESEKRYHEEHYSRVADPLGVNFDLATASQRRPQNLTWAYYDTILARCGGDVRGKRILEMGCGVGLVSLNLLKQGSHIDAFDVSETAIDICHQRAAKYGLNGGRFFVASCEDVELSENGYDAVVGEGILHHADIPTTIANIRRWLKPSGFGVFMEWKRYALVDTLRSLPPFQRWFPPGGVQGYATEYERKLTGKDFDVIRDTFPNTRLAFQAVRCLLTA